MPGTPKKLKDRLEENLSEILQDKFILFDTCVVSKLSRSKKKSPTKEIFDFLEKVNCIPGISEHVQVEILRDQQSIESFKKTEDFLDLLFPKKNLSEDQVSKFIKKMILVDMVNQRFGLKGKQVSFVDLTISVFLHNWSDDLFLATFNINDFSPEIFDIICVLPITIKTKKSNSVTLLLGILKANKDNFDKEVNKIRDEIRKLE